MRGIPSLVTDIRKAVFTEVAKMAYSGGDYTRAEEIPYTIVPGDQPLHRESVFLERAIAGERVRLAMGLSVRSAQKRTLMTEGMDHAAIAEQYYDGPDPIGKTHVREGVVIRIVNRPKFCAYKHKNWFFKALEGIVKVEAEVPDMEEMEYVYKEEINE